MKNLKLKSIVFSLMAVVMVSVFLSSCEKNLIHFDQKESHSEVDESSIVYFKLPESFDKMSEDELTDFFTEKTEDEISKLAEEIPQGSLALRWCTTKALYSYCGFKFDYNCNHNRKRILYRQYCEGQGEVYYWSWGGCC